MTQHERTLAKTVSGVPIHFNPATGRFEAEIDGRFMERSRLREIERAISDSQHQRPVRALTIATRPLTYGGRRWSGDLDSNAQEVEITGHRGGQFRTGPRGSQPYHGRELYRFDPALLARLREIEGACIDAVDLYTRKWREALEQAQCLTPADLLAPDDVASRDSATADPRAD